jgi:hypothetical protein
MANAAIGRVLWWLCLIAAPAVLIGIELFHPAHFTDHPGMFAYLSKPEPYDPHFAALGYPGPSWWFLLHFIQMPLVALVSVGLWLVAGRVHEADGAAALALAWAARAATLVFLVYYTALDSIGGTGLARLIINTKALAASGQLTPAQADGVAHVLDVTWTDPWVGGVGSFISLTGSWAVFVAAVLLAAALFAARKATLPPLVLLIGFGWELQTSHTSPHGPIAFALLIAAAVWMWRLDSKMPHRPAL